jgi:hypothetical protein
LTRQGEFSARQRDDRKGAFPPFVGQRAEAIIDDFLARDISVSSTLWLAEVIGSQGFGLREALPALPPE